MGKDYYGILECERGATDYDIANAYRALAPRWHPSRNEGNIAVAFTRFHNLAEAYEVLSDREKRGCYDRFGEFGLKNGIPDTQGLPQGGYLYSGNAEEIFEKFFGTDNPYYPDFVDQKKFGNMFDFTNGDTFSGEPKQPVDLVVEIPCTLSDLYNGCTKTVSYKRFLLNEDHQTTRTEELRKDITIWRGYSEETEIRHSRMGNESAESHTSDLVFKIKQQPHDCYRRDGDNLIYTHKLSLCDAIQAAPVIIETLDGRQMTVSFDEVINPETQKVVPNEGMPILKINENVLELQTYGKSGKDPERGDLIVEFDIAFPKFLTEDKRQQLSSILS